MIEWVEKGKWGRAVAYEAGWETDTWAVDWINYIVFLTIFQYLCVKYFSYTLFIVICVTTCSYILLHRFFWFSWLS